MKKYLSILTAILLITFTANAELSEKQMAHIVRSCDVSDAAMCASDAESFWKLLQMTNTDYLKAAKSLKSKGDRDIKRELISVLSNCHYYYTSVPTRSDTYSLMEALADSMGIRSTNPIVSFTVTKEPDVALFGYPNGYIFMSEGLYNEIANDTITMQALLAAESAHYALQHAYAHSKWEKSRRKRIKLLRILGATALTVGSAMADVATEGRVPFEIGATMATLVAISPVSNRYTMHYSPIQIHEADIVAYRYMEWATGSGEPYLLALKKVGYYLDATYGLNGGDYPTIVERIDVLEYMRDNPQLRNKIRSNRHAPRPVPKYFDIFAPDNYR